MPFGEDLNAGVGNRTGGEGLKYSMPGDNIRQKFTGYQKDTETSLDFAEARMYENRFGRFTAVDPLLASGKSANPQTFNRYVYVGNNPIIVTDPLGLDWYRKGNQFKWSKDNQSFADGTDFSGWDAVKFDSKGYYSYDCEGCADGTQAYLYEVGGWDYGKKALEIYGPLLADFKLATSFTDPKFLAMRNAQVRDAAADVIGGFSAFTINSVSDTYNFGAGAINWATGSEQLPNAWRYTPERTGERIFYYGANTALIGRSGLALYNGIQTIRSGGLSFNAYKAANGGTETLGYISTVNKQGLQVTQRVSTEFSHIFITQRMQRAANLPNWLVNNRINVVKLNTIQHSLIDGYRFQFLRNGMKSQVCFTCEYNWFTRIGK